ncbi:hypothetical protein DPMN_007568 [Dreissena polymorpha]|uniref:Uncharacterized protein n=1 Tax=Dreissena polymorpha TaxID=45954 RepID=A0A9D4MTV1_DREPO|nr:hypothetical protein DPMN_033347 [Dreissena polymorpha]KAH3883608.1 hypothetical protein DPMN_007568 [Dreissena polymorpha]
MVSRVKYSKRIKTAPTHASVVNLYREYWNRRTARRNHQTINGQEGDSQQGVVARYGHDKTQRKSWTSTTSVSVSSRLDPSFCHHQPRPIDQNNKCCGDGRTTNRQMRAHWKPRSSYKEQQWTALFKNALLTYRYEERARKGVIKIARSNLPKTAYRGWKGALHQQSEQKENK